MSSCRCADIERCKKNIQRLELAAEEIDHLATPYMDISDKLDSLVNTALLAYDSNNFDAFSNEAKGLKYDMRDAMDSCQAAIGDAIDKLQLDLADMEEEDEEYHEEEEEEDDPATGTTTSGT